MKTGAWRMNFDGGCSGNPGPMGLGVAIVNLSDTKEYYQISEPLECGTNNIAEYRALIKGLKFLYNDLDIQHGSVSVFGDSMLVIKQMRNDYVIRDPRLYQLWTEANTLINELQKAGNIVTLDHVERERNTEANKLAQSAVAIAKQNRSLE